MHPGFTCPPAGIARHRDRTCGRAVVAPVGRENLVPARVHARHAQRVLVRLRSAVGEEHLVEIARCELGDEPGCLAACVVGEGGRDRAQAGGLFLDRGDHFRVLVTEVEVDELAREVEVAVAFVVGEIAAQRAGDRQRIDDRLGRPGVKHVPAVVSRSPGPRQRRRPAHLSSPRPTVSSGSRGRPSRRPKSANARSRPSRGCRS